MLCDRNVMLCYVGLDCVLWFSYVMLVWTVFYGSVMLCWFGLCFMVQLVCGLSAETKHVGSDSNGSGGVLLWNLVQTSAVLTDVFMVLCSSSTTVLVLYLRLDSDWGHILSTVLSVISQLFDPCQLALAIHLETVMPRIVSGKLSDVLCVILSVWWLAEIAGQYCRVL
jgi:hypothetical protein